MATTAGKKLSAAAIGGPLGAIVVWALGAFAHVDVPAEVGAAFGAVLTFMASLMIPDDIEE